MGRRRKNRLRQYVRCSAPLPSSTPLPVSANGSEGIAVVLQCSAQRRDRTNQASRQPESSRCSAEGRRIKESHGGQQPNAVNSTQDIRRAVYGPKEGRPRLPLQFMGLLRPDREPVVEIDLQFAGREPVDDALQKRDAFGLRQVHADAFGQQQYWAVGGNPVKPGRIGRRGGDQVISRRGRKDLLAQGDYVRVVDVVPFHT